jgi:hypothetical protein
MTADLQQIVALTLVAIAACALLWRVAGPWFRGGKSSGCSTGCGHCPANKSQGEAPTGQPLVQIQLPGKSRGTL